MNTNMIKTGSILIVYLTIFSPLAQAQIASDGSLSTQVITGDNLNFIIEQGDRLGNNLFHSFSEFSIPTNGSAFFNNSPDIHNIITRITGGKISNIDGFLGANGFANLFFLNPQGVIFGPNANLGLGGSLIVSSAESLQFADGTIFSVQSLTTPKLTQTAPIGLQYGQQPGAIANQSTFTPAPPPLPPLPPGVTEPPPSPPPQPIGLQLTEGQTLALLGGEIKNQGGYLNSPAGRIELGALGADSWVSLKPTDSGFFFDYQGVTNFADITINQGSQISVTSLNPFLPSGDLQIQGNKVLLSESSQISSFTIFALPAGNLVINAQESVEIIGNLAGGIGDTTLTTSTSDNGNGGDITINTKRLILRDGGGIVTNTLDFFPNTQGNSGDINLNATESIKIKGISPISNRPSLLSVATETQGSGGSLHLNTPQLIIENGGKISAETLGAGQGGTINLNATQELRITGEDSVIEASSIKTGNAGDIRIITNNLNIDDQGLITVSATGAGAAGNIDITANEVTLNNLASLRAETAAGDKGSINLNVANDVQLRHNSSITTEATGEASGGNINLKSVFLVGLEGSNIIANAEVGSGGNISIQATGIFLSPESSISASSRFGVDGIIEINTPDVQLDSALTELNLAFIPAEQIIASSCLSRQNEEQGRFVITGTGGLPYSPFETPSGYYNLTSVQQIENAQSLNSNSSETLSKHISWQPGQPIQEAQGITITSEGKVFLGYIDQVSPHYDIKELFCSS